MYAQSSAAVLACLLYSSHLLSLMKTDVQIIRLIEISITGCAWVFLLIVSLRATKALASNPVTLDSMQMFIDDELDRASYTTSVNSDDNYSINSG